MLIDRLLDNLSVTVEPLALCEVARGRRLTIEAQDTATIHFTLRGTGTMTVDRHRVDLAPRTLVLVPPGHRQLLAATSPPAAATPAAPAGATDRADVTGPEGVTRLRALDEDGTADLVAACGRLEARFGDGPALFGLLREPLVLDVADAPRMVALFDEMLAESASRQPGARAMLAALMDRCLVLLFRALCGSEQCPFPWLNALEDPRLAAALDQMLRHPDRAHSLESLAATAAMSRTAFAAEFAARFGAPPMTFLRDVRLRRAAELLRTSSDGVRAVAHAVGFASRAHFSTAFRQRFGVPPGEYRRRVRAPATR